MIVRVLCAMASCVPLAIGLLLLHRALDSPCDTDAVPDAPAPTYNSQGSEQHPWTIWVRYDNVSDTLMLSWHRDGDVYRRAETGTITYPVGGLQDLVEGTITMVNLLGTPRLW